LNVLNEIAEAKREGRVFVYLDEINFAQSAITLREWSAKNSNLSVDQEDVYVGFRNVIAAMSEEKGIIHVRIQPQTVDSYDFSEYLLRLTQKLRNVPIALFMDNASIHKSKTVKPYYEERNIKPIFNVPYSPDFNPIEAVFSKVKRLFGNRRLN